MNMDVIRAADDNATTRLYDQIINLLELNQL